MAEQIKEIESLSPKKRKYPPELEPFKKCHKGLEIAQRLMDMYFEGFPGIANFMKSQKRYAHRNGYVYTLVRRKRRLPDIHSSNYGLVSYNERLSINACIQGSGADIMINAQNKIDGSVIKAPMSNEYVNSEHSINWIADLENNLNDVLIGSERLKELKCDMLVQVHDELLFECPKENCEEAMHIIRDYMINPFGEKVKLNLDLEVGMNHGTSYQVGH